MIKWVVRFVYIYSDVRVNGRINHLILTVKFEPFSVSFGRFQKACYTCTWYNHYVGCSFISAALTNESRRVHTSYK